MNGLTNLWRFHDECFVALAKWLEQGLPHSGQCRPVGIQRLNILGRNATLEMRLDILHILANERGRCFSTGELISALRGDGFACEDTMLYVHVSNLRRKLGPAASLICSSRNAGYSLSR